LLDVDGRVVNAGFVKQFVRRVGGLDGFDFDPSRWKLCPLGVGSDAGAIC
jgi:hypothetical protein